MNYMLLIYHDEQAWNQLTEAERQQIYGEYGELIQELKSSGQYLAGSELQPTTTATGVRERDGKQIVTDGPFAETREPTWGSGRRPGGRTGLTKDPGRAQVF